MSPPCCVTIGKWLNLSEPRHPQQQREDREHENLPHLVGNGFNHLNKQVPDIGKGPVSINSSTAVVVIHNCYPDVIEKFRFQIHNLLNRIQQLPHHPTPARVSLDS